VNGVFNQNALMSQASPGGGFFNPLTNVTLNRVPDVTGKIAWDPMIGANKAHFEAFVMYREYFARFNFANQYVSNVAYCGHINIELFPKTMELQAAATNGAMGRFSASPLPDATFMQSGAIQPITIFSVNAGLVWHTTPILDLYTYYGLEQGKAAFSFAGNQAFGWGNPVYDNSGCNTEGAPSATCNGNTHKVQQFTGGFYYTAYQGSFGAVKLGTQYSYTQRFAFEGFGGAPKTDDHIIMTNIRYYPF